MIELRGLRFRGDIPALSTGHLRALEAYFQGSMRRDDLSLAADVLQQFLDALDDPSAAMEQDLGFLQLQLERYDDGWNNFEARLRLPGRELPRVALPRWDGDARKSVFVYAEQGLGDTIQFARYLPLLAGRCRRVVFACQPTLAMLFARSFPSIAVIPAPGPMIACDSCLPLLSLPLACDMRVPAPFPQGYLETDAILREKWREELGQRGLRKPLIGLVWRGNPEHRHDARRSLSLEVLTPLLARYKSSLVGLVQHPTDLEVELCAAYDIHLPQDSGLDDLAALLTTLDGLITCDSAPLHLAGSLGVRAAALIPFRADWRWQLTRMDSPWYTSITLLRQQSESTWSGVLDAIPQTLKSW